MYVLLLCIQFIPHLSVSEFTSPENDKFLSVESLTLLKLSLNLEVNLKTFILKIKNIIKHVYFYAVIWNCLILFQNDDKKLNC